MNIITLLFVPNFSSLNRLRTQYCITTAVFTRTILLNNISVQNTYIHLHLFVLLQNRASTFLPLSDSPFFSETASELTRERVEEFIVGTDSSRMVN